MKYKLENNQIIFDRKPRKSEGGIKVYFYREVDESLPSDYPIAISDTPKGKTMDWVEGMKILRIEYRKPIFFGLFGYKYEIVEEIK